METKVVGKAGRPPGRGNNSTPHLNAMRELFGMDAKAPSEKVLAEAVKRLTVSATSITVWRFDEAPDVMQALSGHGGDEDWLAVVPKGFSGSDWISWAKSGTPFGPCEVSEHEVPQGKVLIGAHS